MAKTQPVCGTTKLNAEGGGRAQWDGQPKRFPKKGEFFISGAFPVAYLARNDLTVPYFIAKSAQQDVGESLRTFSVTGNVRGDEPPRDLLLHIAGLANAPVTTPLQMAERANQIMQLAADVIITVAVASALEKAPGAGADSVQAEVRQ
jgi:hypothetical protein